MRSFLERIADDRPLLYDGGFGTELFARGIELANSALANELYPDIVRDIHFDYIEAGSEAIGTNTFVASFPHLEMAGKDASESDGLIRLSVEHARAAIERSGRDVYLAGSIGPLPGAIEADSGDTEFGIANSIARDAHERVGTTLAEGGVDFFCVETMFSANEAALAVDVLRQFDLPIAVNQTYKYTKDRATGEVVYKTDWGHSAADLLEILAAGLGGVQSGGRGLLEHIQVVGLNCGAESRRDEHTGMPYAINGIGQLKRALDARGEAPKRMMAYPNAGRARLDDQHRTYYDNTPEQMAAHVPELLEAGAYFIGGCCGTGVAHIRAFREAMDRAAA
ncbi:MAG: homocysteine S-methyltransferase family protein [candidate division Zixibacteria bacterium]|nr:homocysteine S-methyltransferase family protein [candidate division Zixibacteria bacterium]